MSCVLLSLLSDADMSTTESPTDTVFVEDISGTDVLSAAPQAVRLIIIEAISATTITLFTELHLLCNNNHHRFTLDAYRNIIGDIGNYRFLQFVPFLAFSTVLLTFNLASIVT